MMHTMAKTVNRCAVWKDEELLEGSICLSGTWVQGSCRESDLSKPQIRGEVWQNLQLPMLTVQHTVQLTVQRASSHPYVSHWSRIFSPSQLQLSRFATSLRF